MPLFWGGRRRVCRRFSERSSLSKLHALIDVNQRSTVRSTKIVFRSLLIASYQ